MRERGPDAVFWHGRIDFMGCFEVCLAVDGDFVGFEVFEGGV